MSSSPIKLFGFIGVAALIAGGMISNQFEPKEASVPGSPAAQSTRSASSSSWWSGLFDMEFNSGSPKPAVVANAQPAPVAEPAKATGFGSVRLKRDQSGHYSARIEIEGVVVPMLVDTGATVIALRYEDASRLGINPTPSDYTVSIATANGEVKVAKTNLREVRLDNITVTNVQAVIVPQGALSQSLLGMSFMNKLGGFEISGGELVLKP